MQILIEQLSKIPNLSIPDDSITKLLSEITNKELGEYLEEILLNESKISEIARNSYIHQLGFEKYNLIPTNESRTLGLRLHYWQKYSMTPFKGEIHDHLHNFTSKVFLGSLIHNFYKIESSRKKYSQFEYILNQRSNVSKQVFTGYNGVQIIETMKVNQGETYTLSNDTLHSVEVESREVLSMIIQGMPVKSVATVFKDRNKANNMYIGVGIGKLTPKKLMARFSELSKKLKDSNED